MVNDKILLTYGVMLHDVGKLASRASGQIDDYVTLGAKFITEEVAPQNDAFAGETGRSIVEQMKFHYDRAPGLKDETAMPCNSLAYITYFADTIAAGVRCIDKGDTPHTENLDKSANLRKIFNILNGHDDNNTIEHDDYASIRERLARGLASLPVDGGHVNALLNLLEATTDKIPASVDPSQLIDVSLYDYAKIKAGLALCVYDYLMSCGSEDYRGVLCDEEKSEDAYDKQMFLLCSCDISGIQDFIYNISGSGALKQLRARSLYLELLLEHVADEILERLELCRANLLYTGGGHAYLILPNTKGAKEKLDALVNELQTWFLENYRTDLYMACAHVECSARELMNDAPDKGAYSQLFHRLYQELSEQKLARYSAQDLRELNFGDSSEQAGKHESRECSECHRSNLPINKEGKCTLCAALGVMSKELIKKDVFAVEKSESPEDIDLQSRALALPFGYQLLAYTQDAYQKTHKGQPPTARVYVKHANEHVGEHAEARLPDFLDYATYIWMGDYVADMGEEGIAAYAKQGESLKAGKGIERLGVLRADVDNLGATFISGIPVDKASISRTATLSRLLSRFFKGNLNDILREGAYQAQIIYSGGDDLFIIGNWCDILYAACDIRRALDEFTGNGSLTISAGIGMFDDKYPIARMAAETGELEDAAKLYVSTKEAPDDVVRTKNAVTLWSTQAVFGWDEFIGIVELRMQEIAQTFKDNKKGKAFIYRLLDLLRATDGAVSAPRLAYLLARSFEEVKDGEQLSRKFYGWAMDEREKPRLAAALEWYVYSERERG